MSILFDYMPVASICFLSSPVNHSQHLTHFLQSVPKLFFRCISLAFLKYFVFRGEVGSLKPNIQPGERGNTLRLTLTLRPVQHTPDGILLHVIRASRRLHRIKLSLGSHIIVRAVKQGGYSRPDEDIRNSYRILAGTPLGKLSILTAKSRSIILKYNLDSEDKKWIEMTQENI